MLNGASERETSKTALVSLYSSMALRRESVGSQKRRRMDWYSCIGRRRSAANTAKSVGRLDTYQLQSREQPSENAESRDPGAQQDGDHCDQSH